MRISRRVVLLSLPFLLIAILAIFRGPILWAMGAMLVNAENPRKADIVVVLAGDSSGRRILMGAELVRQGYAPKVLISCGPIYYGQPESDMAADFAVQRGYSRDTMICFRRRQFSTVQEGTNIPPVLRAMGVHTVLLVTSPSHTARATRIFRRLAPDLEIHPVAAPDPLWCRGYWWTDRECEKTWLLEEMKTFADFFRV